MKDRKIKTIIICLIILIVLIPIIFVVLDLLNVTKIIPLTYEYDWLAFIGTYVSGLCTIVLGVVSIKQNNTLSEVNNKMLSNEMITTRFSKIELESINYYDPRHSIGYGIKMKENKKVENKNLQYNRLILQIRDENDLPLMYGKIDKINIFYDYERAYINEKQKTYYSDGNEVELEVTPESDRVTYYLPICIFDDDKLLEELFNSKKLRIEATIYIRNSFNVVSKAEYTIHLSKAGKAQDWFEYKMSGRKIYFKEITYSDIKYN